MLVLPVVGVAPSAGRRNSRRSKLKVTIMKLLKKRDNWYKII